jgi:Holliday junction resolvase RusA-like endonuclease
MKEFPTHLPYTNNKVAPNKYIKINGQSIYNGKLNRFSRNILIGNMHDYLMNNLTNIKITDYPIRVELIINTVINHDLVQRRFNKKINEFIVNWKKPEDNYKPSNDIDNVSWVWIKTFFDALHKSGVIEDDNLRYIKGYSVDFNEVKEFIDRSLIFKIYKA